jgi:hypothetical protein
MLFMPIGFRAAVAFIQWGEYKHWAERQKHTHWVFMELRDDNLHVFCNRDGWFSAETEHFREYLNNGYVRSILALENYVVKE